MHSISRIRSSWQAMQSEKTFPPPRRFILYSFLSILLVTLGTFLFIIILFLSINYWLPSRNGNQAYNLIEDAFRNFVHHSSCSITHSSLYKIPYQKTTPPTTLFCKNRATLLTSMSGGSRKSFNEPYVGKNCTYKWFSTPEICMILERHNTITFVGDETTDEIYMALNILLSEDLGLGGLQSWRLGKKEKMECRCKNQFSRKECQGYAVKSSEETKKNGGRTNTYYCGRVKHAYIPVSTTPASLTSTNLFKELTYGKPHPWQPSPLILSFAKDTATTTLALSEWASLAAGAERNIPLLFLGAHAGKNRTGPADNGHEEIASIAKEIHLVFWSYGI